MPSNRLGMRLQKMLNIITVNRTAASKTVSGIEWLQATQVAKTNVANRRDHSGPPWWHRTPTTQGVPQFDQAIFHASISVAERSLPLLNVFEMLYQPST